MAIKIHQSPRPPANPDPIIATSLSTKKWALDMYLHLSVRSMYIFLQFFQPFLAFIETGLYNSTTIPFNVLGLTFSSMCTPRSNPQVSPASEVNGGYVRIQCIQLFERQHLPGTAFRSPYPTTGLHICLAWSGEALDSDIEEL